MTSSLSLHVVINTARLKKTSTYHDGNTTHNHQTLSHNGIISPHNNVAIVHCDKTLRQNFKTKRIKITQESCAFPLGTVGAFQFFFFFFFFFFQSYKNFTSQFSNRSA